jgi:LuxR family maltose regulon positive regulatory protein
MLFWFEITCETRCRFLIAEGSNKSLREAEEVLEKYEIKNVAHRNNLHLIDIFTLQAILFYKQDKIEKAFMTLEKALILAEPSEFILPFLELGNLMVNLINMLPKRISHKTNIENALHCIKTARKSINRDLKDQGSEIVLSHNVISFTPREMAVLKYVSIGMRNKEIAAALFVSDDTVKKHLYNMFQKLSVKNRLSLVSKAAELGLI